MRTYLLGVPAAILLYTITHLMVVGIFQLLLTWGWYAS